MEKLIGSRIDDTTLHELDSAASKMGHSRSDALREAIKLYIEYAKGTEVIVIRDVPKKQAKGEIREYLRGKGRAWTGDIADDLRLDYELVLECLDELMAEERVEEIQ